MTTDRTYVHWVLILLVIRRRRLTHSSYSATSVGGLPVWIRVVTKAFLVKSLTLLQDNPPFLITFHHTIARPQEDVLLVYTILSNHIQPYRQTDIQQDMCKLCLLMTVNIVRLYEHLVCATPPIPITGL